MPKVIKRLHRSDVRKMQESIDRRPRALNGMRVENVINGYRIRSRVRSYMPGNPASVERIQFPNGHFHRVLDPGGQYHRRVQITYQGSRLVDFDVANRSAGFRTTPAGQVWHHYHDYVPGPRDAHGHPTPGRGTLYLMDIQTHARHHAGGVEQYKQIHGGGY